ncbi:hypothetical protein HL667_04735 [Bradyrhizobium sp. 83012]|uniref:Uncharacterized protein n=1 Tax=Bradyrhizobium aeschynomenes TaxID=2734909 RepID=A0ABX2C7R0_9BRAD|nr:hypothetical protein [Bradyrhizobium aeschynomenes]NPU14781.1 hypothetical protein [Bradyrhizobium aeschynomenes]NPU64296.1 hypothetical protein [Bradyrhizobium aeschynomenes]
MICEQSRVRLALALRRYVAGRIDNDTLDEVEVDWRDRGAVAVKQAAWTLYDDTKSHYAKGRHKISRRDRRNIAKWIVFLHSRNEYLWPEYSFLQIVNWPMNILTFGWWERRKARRWQEFEEAGEFAAWPFIAMSDLEAATAKPRYFAGVGRSRRV